MRKFRDYLTTPLGKTTLLGGLILGVVLAAGFSAPVLAQGLPLGGGGAALIGDLFKDGGEGVLATLFTAMNYFTMQMLQIVLKVARIAIAPIIDGALRTSLGQPDMLLNHPIAVTLWGYMLIVANAIYLLALLIAAVAIITRLNVGTYNIKKILGSFIMAVALTNLSFIIVRILFDVGNKLVTVVYTMVNETGLLHGDLAITSTDKLLKVFSNLLNATKIPMIGSTDLYIIAEEMIITAFVVILFWLLAKLALLFLERMIRLFISAVTAPLIFAASMLPTFQKAASGWWDSIIKWVLVLPITIFVLLISLFFFEQAGFKSVDDFQFQKLAGKIDLEALRKELEAQSVGVTFDNNTDNHLTQVFIAETSTDPNPNDPTNSSGKFTFVGYFWLAIAMFALYSAGNVGNMMKLGSTFTGMVDNPNKLFKQGQGLARSAQKLTADTWGGKNLVGRLAPGIYGSVVSGNKPMQKFEDWRQSLTPVKGGGKQQLLGNALAWGLNYHGSMAAVKAQRKSDAEESQGRGFANQRLAAKQILDKAAGPGKEWKDLEKEEQTAKKNSDPNIRAAAARFSQYKKSSKFATRLVAKRSDMEDLDPNDILKDLSDMENGIEDFDLGAVQVKIKQLQLLSKSNRPMGKRAKKILENGELFAKLGSLGESEDKRTKGTTYSNLARDLGVKAPSLDGKKDKDDDGGTTATDNIDDTAYLKNAKDLTDANGRINDTGLSPDELQQFGANPVASKVADIDALWDEDIDPFLENNDDGIKLRRAYKKFSDEVSHQGGMTDDEKETLIKTLMKDAGYVNSTGKLTPNGEDYAITALLMNRDGVQMPELEFRTTLHGKNPGIDQTDLAQLIADIKTKVEAGAETSKAKAVFKQEQLDLGTIYSNTAKSRGEVIVDTTTGEGYDLTQEPEQKKLSARVKLVYNSAEPGSSFEESTADQILSTVLSRTEDDLDKMSQADKLKHLRILGASLDGTHWKDVTG